MDRSNFYLVLNPEIHISENKSSVLLYNTKSGEYLESEDFEVVKLVKEINIMENLYCRELGGDQIRRNKKLYDFVEKLKSKKMGYLIPKKADVKPPIVLRPVLGLKRRGDGQSFQFDNDQIMNYLQKLTIQINDHCDIGCGFCDIAFKQINCCFSRKCDEELAFDELEKILKEIKYSSIRYIMITGGNIFDYSYFDKLCKILITLDKEVCISINYLNVLNNKKKLKKLKNCLITAIVNPEVDNNKLIEVTESFKKNKINFSFQFIVDSEISLNEVIKYVNSKDINVYSINPILTKKNIGFFRKYVFVDRNKIFSTKHEMKELYLKKVKNHFTFGNIFIDSLGNIFSDKFNTRLGNIEIMSIREVIYKELNFGESWSLTREKVKPCKDCLYNLLCPSISTYEISEMYENRLNISGCTIYKKELTLRREKNYEQIIQK